MSIHQKEIMRIANIKLLYSEWYIRSSEINKYEYNIINNGGNIKLIPKLLSIIG